jgi:RHS repeat-associated protein
VNATGNRQWYTGKPVDSETGLSNFGARMYDPVIGRFMGVDAVGFSEGNLHSFNRYTYGNNNPLRFIDPDGNSPMDWVHGGLTAASFCPSVCGSVFSAADGVVYAAQGDKLGAGISFGAAALGVVSDAGAAKVLMMGAKEAAAVMKVETTAAKIEAVAAKETAPLQRLHSDKTYQMPGEAKSALDSQRKRSTDEIINSLKPGSKEPLKAKADGTIMDGNTRVKVLEERGVNVNELPRTSHE